MLFLRAYQAGRMPSYGVKRLASICITANSMLSTVPISLVAAVEQFPVQVVGGVGAGAPGTFTSPASPGTAVTNNRAVRQSLRMGLISSRL